MTAIEQAIKDGALVFVSHSGGKDSQAMYSYLADRIPADQIIVVHANLGEVEWSGVMDHIKDNISHELNVVRAGKTLLEMVEHRFNTKPDVPSWPSPKHRQCTSDLKRGPIQKFIRAEMKRRGSLLAINAMGLRAEESSARSKRPVHQLNNTLSKAGRTVYDWNPIHSWSTAKVFNTIRDFGQSPFWAYAKGNERLSCVFCIMGCDGDLRNGAEQNPELFRKYIEMEERTGYTMFPTGSLAEKIGTPTGPSQGELFNTRSTT
jgi:3'-phosphoadenosine 5'-phosphosulfate sulfotransferase (PAPS reductase)/FAD synthetase